MKMSIVRIGQTLALFFLLSFCNNNPIAAQTPDTCRIGVYVWDVYNFDLVRRSYTADFWLWMNYKNDSLFPLETVEVTNAKTFKYVMPSIKKLPWITYGHQKVNAEVKKVWNLRYFPFDVQEFKIELESASHEDSEMVYVLDSSASSYNPDMQMEEWTVVDFKSGITTNKYNTNYGDPSVKEGSSFSRFTASVWLQRRGESIFLKMFMGLYIAFSISLLIFALPYDSGDRYGILVGSLFAAVGNKHIVDFFIPNTNTYTMVDKIHHFCFFELLLFFFASIVIVSAGRSRNKRRAMIFNRGTLIIGVLSFVAFNVYMVWEAITAMG